MCINSTYIKLAYSCYLRSCYHYDFFLNVNVDEFCMLIEASPYNVCINNANS